MSKIDVFCVLGRNGAHYATLMRNNFLALSSGKHTFSWNCIASGEFTVIPDGFTHVGSVLGGSNSSFNHARGLNLVSSLAKAPYSLLADVDLMSLCYGWDDVFINEFSDTVAAVGVSHPSGMTVPYVNFPSVVCMMLRTEVLKKITPDFSPECNAKRANKIARRCVATAKEAAKLGVKVNTFLKCDTGWLVPGEFFKNGYRGVCFDWNKFGSSYAIFRHKGKPVLSHMTSSICWGPAHSKYLAWKTLVDKELSNLPASR